MGKLFLFGFGIWLNWAAFFVSLLLNIIRVALMDKSPFIHWGYLLIWFICNIVFAFFIFKYFANNSGKIAGKMVKDTGKFTEKFFDKFEEEVKK
jgi:hypothetical protein